MISFHSSNPTNFLTISTFYLFVRSGRNSCCATFCSCLKYSTIDKMCRLCISFNKIRGDTIIHTDSVHESRCVVKLFDYTVTARIVSAVICRFAILPVIFVVSIAIFESLAPVVPVIA